MPVVVVDYDPRWPEAFERLRSHVWPAVRDVALTIEHVGSTSVPGLAAKPAIDVSVVVPDASAIPAAIAGLEAIGYVHLGEMGIEGREAFEPPAAAASAGLPVHHLYVCPRDGLGLANHLAVRDYLRAHPDTARRYGELKKELARRFPDDAASYVDGKTEFVVDILRRSGLAPEQLASIERANRKPST
jgi:GrpB-like predicted nucleotidyltransferase (UPF0157 family)